MKFIGINIAIGIDFDSDPDFDFGSRINTKMHLEHVLQSLPQIYLFLDHRTVS